MNKKGIMALALVTAYAFGANAQNVDYYTPGEGEGIAFFLPKTAVEVNVIATKVKYTPGDFCQYANRYLRINNVTSEPSTDWEIKKIEVRPVGIPDSTKAYIMKLSDKSVMSNIEVTDNNIIKAINTSAPKSAKAEYILEMPQRAEDGRKYMTEEIITAGSTAKMAELTAKEIYNIRESKNLILRGQADTMPKDGASLKLIMDNLEKQEKALVQMFTGIKTREDKLFTAVILPEGDTTEKVVMRFSQKLGVLSSDNLAGKPMYIKIENINPAQTSAADSEDGKKKKAPKGIIYNIPAKANVMLTFKGKTLFEDNNMMFAQFGNTELLVNDLFNKKVNTRVIFDTVTGGIQKIDKD
ncbi:DUF4831 family protein [Bacteroides sp. ET336]|uniref:DUF4831 family protein n=1 Tax=Bacteroides sp. ET336 TaxID=2972459 RepID=UPI0021ABBA09|nr:DUF4831 family protein [Bacteroides sp. ET336]MCR8892845.1 DUF4831 family protein [Bacteroides sp. ET336]MDN0057342.1 DUF4831 family protein [Bacteroides caecigallinarum]